MAKKPSKKGKSPEVAEKKAPRKGSSAKTSAQKNASKSKAAADRAQLAPQSTTLSPAQVIDNLFGTERSAPAINILGRQWTLAQLNDLLSLSPTTVGVVTVQFDLKALLQALSTASTQTTLLGVLIDFIRSNPGTLGSFTIGVCASCTNGDVPSDPGGKPAPDGSK